MAKSEKIGINYQTSIKGGPSSLDFFGALMYRHKGFTVTLQWSKHLLGAPSILADSVFTDEVIINEIGVKDGVDNCWYFKGRFKDGNQPIKGVYMTTNRTGWIAPRDQ